MTAREDQPQVKCWHCNSVIGSRPYAVGANGALHWACYDKLWPKRIPPDCQKDSNLITPTGKEFTGEMTKTEDQPRPTPPVWLGGFVKMAEQLEAAGIHSPEEFYVRMRQAGFGKIAATEAQSEAPQVHQCPNCGGTKAVAFYKNGESCQDDFHEYPNPKVVETGAHPSQDARAEFLTGILAKYGVDCGPSIATHGGKLIYGDEFMHAADEIINWARSTPSLPSKVERELQVAHNILRQFGRYCKLPDGKCDTCLKVESEMLQPSTPSLPAQDARDLLKKLLATDGHDKDCPFTGCRCEYGEDYKVARAEAAAYLRGSTPSPDPPPPELKPTDLIGITRAALDQLCNEKTALEAEVERLREALRQRVEERDEWKRQSLTLVVLLKAKCSDEEWATMNAKFDAALAPSLPTKEGQ